jgi:hypothetical protein
MPKQESTSLRYSGALIRMDKEAGGAPANPEFVAGVLTVIRGLICA